MSWLSAAVTEAQSSGTLWLFALVLVNTLLVRAVASDKRGIATPIVLFSLHLVVLPVAGYFRERGAHVPGYSESHLPLMIFGALAGVTAVGSLVFSALLPMARLSVPRIVQDVLIGAASIITIFTVASRAGLNLSGLIATSAVLTAVIGLSLQDTLGNILSGLALQTDDSIHVGDWVKVGDVTGRVVEIRWRYTAVETRNWETAVIPNSVLVKNQVLVLGRRKGQPTQLRRWVWFNVDYRFPPTEVIRAVDDAVRAAPIERVAQNPQPNCVLMDFQDSYGRYAMRYWLTEIAVDDPTDSAVRARIYFALQRAGLRLSIPAHAIFVTEETEERETRKHHEEHTRRVHALSKIDLFATLSPEELSTLADSLRFAPFVTAEVLTKQGATAHWLYVIESGEVAVRVAVEGEEHDHEVAKLGAGSFFGERGLLTGDKRSATIVALSNVECWRLDKAAFQELLQRRPEIAEEVAEVLANREVETNRVRGEMEDELAARRARAKTYLVDKIRHFFGMGESNPPPPAPSSKTASKR